MLSDLGAWKKFRAFMVIQSNAQALGTSAQATCAGFKAEEAGSCPRTTDNPARETMCSMTEPGQNAIKDAEKCRYLSFVQCSFHGYVWVTAGENSLSLYRRWAQNAFF